MSAAPAYASLLPEGLEVAAMVRDAGAATTRRRGAEKYRQRRWRALQHRVMFKGLP